MNSSKYPVLFATLNFSISHIEVELWKKLGKMLYDFHQNNRLSPVTFSLFLAFWPCVPKVVFDMSYWAFFWLLTICPREKSPQKHWEYMAGTVTSVQFYALFLKFSSWALNKKKSKRLLLLKPRTSSFFLLHQCVFRWL